MSEPITIQAMIEVLENFDTIFIQSAELDYEAWRDEDYGWLTNDNVSHDTAEDAVVYIVRRIGGIANVTGFAENEWGLE